MFCWNGFCWDFLNVTSVLKLHLLNWCTVLDWFQYLRTHYLGTKLHELSEHTWKRNVSSASYSSKVTSSGRVGGSTAGLSPGQVTDTGPARWCKTWTEAKEDFFLWKKSCFLSPFNLNKKKISNIDISHNVSDLFSCPLVFLCTSKHFLILYILYITYK